MGAGGGHNVLTGGGAELCAAYAVHALPDVERAEFEQHLQNCEACAAEVDSLLATTARLGAGASPLTPTAEARAATFAAVASAAQVAAQPVEVSDLAGSADVDPERDAAPATAPPTRTPWRRAPSTPVAGVEARNPRAQLTRTSRILAVAATVLALVGIGLGAVVVNQQQRLDDLAASGGSVERILNAGDRRTVTGVVRAGGNATAVVADGRAVVLLENLPALRSNRTYQLWVGENGAVHSAGVVTLQQGRATVVVDGVPARGDLMLSEEPAGGSKQPTTTPVWHVRA